MQTHYVDAYSGLRRELEVALSFAPTRTCAQAAAKAIAAYLDDDPRITVRLAGLGVDGSRIILTLAVTLGTIDEIKTADPRSRAAVSFLQRLVDDLAAYDPCFTAVPAPASFDARAAALAIAEGTTGVPATVARLVAVA